MVARLAKPWPVIARTAHDGFIVGSGTRRLSPGNGDELPRPARGHCHALLTDPG